MSLKRKSQWSHYSKGEIDDMTRCFYQSAFRNCKARKLYSELYPERRLPEPELFFQMTRRAKEDLDQDVFSISTNSDTDDDDKEKVRLAMDLLVKTPPIVCTTRLEEMSIFRADARNIEPKRLLKAIYTESKPQFEECKTSCNTNHALYDEMVKKLDYVFQKKTIGTGSVTVIEDDDSVLSSEFEDCKTNCNTNHTSYDEMIQKLDYVYEQETIGTGNVTVIDDDDSVLSSDVDDIPIGLLRDNSNLTLNTAPIINFNEVEPNKPKKLVENIHEDLIVLNKYRSVFLSFFCTNTKVTDLYYIDDKGLITLHSVINNQFEVSEYVGLTETFVFFYCCWYKRRELTLALDELPKETLKFVCERHFCILSSCTCCCCPQKLNALKSRDFTKAQSNENVTLIDDTSIKDELIKQEMEYETSELQSDITIAIQTKDKQKRTAAKEINKKSLVASKNKWLQEVISDVYISTVCTSTSTNSFVTAMRMIDVPKMKKSSKLLEPNLICRPETHMVIHVTFMELNEIYEFNSGKLISRATSVNKDYLSREVFKRIRHIQVMNALADDISRASRENIVSSVTVPCCWYFHEVLINARCGAYDLMRQPHTCAVSYCKCCCKSLRLAEINKQIHLYVKNKSFDRLRGYFVPTNDLIQFGNKAPRKKRNPIVHKQTSSKRTNKKNEVTAPPVEPVGSELALLNRQIQIIEIDDDDDNVPSPSHSPVPAVSQTRPDSHTLGIHTNENPSSKITLYTPEMACTITTYALDSNETLDKLDCLDPLGGASADAKDYCVDSSLVPKDEDEDSDEMGSNDVESDPLIYANEEKDTSYDPLEIDDPLIEHKDEPHEIDDPLIQNKDEPHGVPTNSSVNATSINVDKLISSILERFQNVKLFINEEGHVTADIGVCVSTLTTGELKVLANILSNAQEQVKSLGLIPGTVLRGEMPSPSGTQLNVAQNVVSSIPHTLPSFMVPETKSEMMTVPRIKNVFSLRDALEHLKADKLKARPFHELTVKETTKGNKTLEAPNKPVSLLLAALKSDMKPMTNQQPVKAQTSSSTYDHPNIQQLSIPNVQYQSQSTQTPPKSGPQQNFEGRTIVYGREPRKARSHPFAKRFDDLKQDFFSTRSQYVRKNVHPPTLNNPSRNMPLSSPSTSSSTATSATSVNPSSSLSGVVISIDSDDD